ncbi:MAG TPA: fumarylacetoacetase [Bryobacteraceae bacterium]|jgi:fumarylacetoacetase|nr:fumarylacetoacetase [Bryobacteraceae bacterium]
MNLNETHDPALTSWVASANDPACDFPIQNLPFCTFRHKHGAPRVGVGIGDSILDVPDYQSMNALMEGGRAAASELRLKLSRALRADNPYPPKGLLHPISECTLQVPAQIGDYTDFYASIFHATNVGSMFRPDNPLLPNYKYVPIGYHGRASSIIASGTRVRRPSGQIQSGDAPPVFGPSRQLDYECELGCFVGRGNDLGHPIPIAQADDHLFGVCLLNDWSARDIQRWEYQPLGPFLAKSFATSVSPWVVTFDALEPFRVRPHQRPAGDPAPLDYLNSAGDRGIAITLEVWFSTAKMDAPIRLSHARFDQMYWTLGQMLAHHSSNGCNLRPGDLLGSGTVSGPGKDERGSLLELTWRGTEPLQLPTGESRKFLEDGDEVILGGHAEREGFRRIGLGECRGTLISNELFVNVDTEPRP